MTINNFYYIDKPIDYTSFDVIRVLKKKLNIKRIGHTGTLDPLATGGLLVAVGNYTKLIPYFEKDIKEYEFEILLNGTTESFDLGEEVQYISEKKQEEFKKSITKESIEKIIKEKFTGNIKQIPPKYSALKIDGQRAYKLAREGKIVDLKSREVIIHEIEILDFNYPKLSIRAKVSAGTYIRSIAHDLGQDLKTGGYITKLRRTKIGNLDIKETIKLDDFNKENSLDIKKILDKNNFIKLELEILEKINNGLLVKGDFDFKKDIDLFVVDNNKITNIVNFDGEYLKPIRKI